MCDEKEQLRSFVLTVLNYVQLPISDAALEPIRNANSLRSLRMAAFDMAEMCEDLSQDEIAEIDEILSKQDLPSLTQMSDRRYRELRTILLRNRIESDDEWRLVESCVSNLDTGVLTKTDRDRAERLLGEYSPSQ